ncbi:hypothetical protein MCOR25_008560 [Pyricularia grisea]|nr:hypothetical protein MCOR25_008560 [Pyricularia grisea]
MSADAVAGRDRVELAKEVWEMAIQPLNRQVVKEIQIPLETAIILPEGRKFPLNLKHLVLRTKTEENAVKLEGLYQKLQAGQGSREKFAEFIK